MLDDHCFHRCAAERHKYGSRRSHSLFMTSYIASIPSRWLRLALCACHSLAAVAKRGAHVVPDFQNYCERQWHFLLDPGGKLPESAFLEVGGSLRPKDSGV